MFEIIAILVDIIRNVIDPVEIVKRKKEGKLQHLGSEMFSLYSNLSEVYHTGEQIVHNIERYINSVEEWYQTRKYNHIGGESERGMLRWYIRDQLVNLKRVGWQTVSLAEELDIMDAMLEKRIKIVMYGKWDALGVLSDLLENSFLPIITDDKLLERLLLITGGTERYNLGISSIHSEIEGQAIPIDVKWSEDTYKILKMYLEKRKPREKLEELRALIEQLHAILKETFTIQDILYATYDKKSKE